MPAPDLPARVRDALCHAADPVCVYVYDTDTLRERAAAVRAALPPASTLLYAVKANSHPAVVRALAAATDGLEVASGGELDVARHVGARRIVFGGPAKTDAELRAALAVGAQVNVESRHELRRLHLIARDAGTVADIAVRVNRRSPTLTGSPTPTSRTLTGSHAMTGTATAFGVDETQLGDVLHLARQLTGVHVIGFHLHAVSNNLDAQAHAEFVTDSITFCVRTAERHDVDLSIINVGGGLGVDYRGSGGLDLDALSTALRGVTPPATVDLIFEPGRMLAADAGWYGAEVLDLKHTHGRTFAVLRGGTHHFRLPSAWGYSHPFSVMPVERWPYPFARPQVTGAHVDAVGELCTPRDVLTRGQYVDRLRIGDVLVFARTGAYGWDISHHEFLRHPPPQLMLL